MATSSDVAVAGLARPPCYGEDSHNVHGEPLLGMSSQEIDALAADGVI